MNNEMQSTSSVNVEESALLRGILKEASTQDFFQRVWQTQAQVYRYSPEIAVDSAVDEGDGIWDDERMQHDPLNEVVKQRWHILRTLFQRSEEEHASHRFRDGPPIHEFPLIFRDRELQHREDIEQMYGTSLFAPYLNGCSVVLNHGDLLSPWIAALCQDLQKTFPHAYANCYLTPPNSQAVPAHADDRDVLVIQLVGCKHWQVYEKVPISYPYPHEQVGKEGLPVPHAVLEGPVGISTTLRPGDVLYMPRGFVHQANCSHSLSFHITIALATHDWTLAGMMSIATQAILTRNLEYRKSILPLVPGINDENQLQDQIDVAIQTIQEEVTAENLLRNLRQRLEQHNHRAFPLRMKLIHEARFPFSPTTTSEQPVQEGDNPNHPSPLSVQTGPFAAKAVTFASKIRALTPEERSQVAKKHVEKRGLHVREEIADSIMSVVARLKAEPSLSSTVMELRSVMGGDNPLVCDLTLLSLAKRGVELGAFAIV